jgi:hypothetical protein
MSCVQRLTWTAGQPTTGQLRWAKDNEEGCRESEDERIRIAGDRVTGQEANLHEYEI